MFTCGNPSNPICSGECIWYFTLGAEDWVCDLLVGEHVDACS